MNGNPGLTGVSLLFVLSALVACGGGGGGDGSGTLAPPNNGGSGATPMAWGTAELIETNDAGTGAGDPHIAIDAKGNALAVWWQSDGTRTHIWANRYTPGTGWGTPEIIETETDGGAFLQIAMNANGNALAVWHDDGDIWSNHYTPGTGWGTAALVETDNSGIASLPQIAIDSGGNALAVWQVRDGAREDLWSSRYTAGTGWGAPLLIETDNAGTVGVAGAQIAIDANGNALAVWHQSDGTSTNNVWYNRYSAGTGWGTAALIAGGAAFPQIAFDANGNALAVWSQSDGTRYNIWSNRYTAGSGWGTAMLIETDNAGSAIGAQIVIDASGNALAVWEQSGDRLDNIWSNRYAAGTGWGTAVMIAENALGPQIAIDASGNALAAWNDSDAGPADGNIWSKYYAAGTGWGTAAIIDDNTGLARSPRIAMEANGNALAVWAQSAGTRFDIWANRFQ